MIYEGLAGLLRSDTQITALVGTRVWFMAAPADQPYPDIIQYPSSGNMMEADLEGMEPPWSRRISFECRARTFGELQGQTGSPGLGDHVIRVLNNYGGIVAGEQIQMCQLASDVPDLDETSAIRRRIIDFRVIHSPV